MQGYSGYSCIYVVFSLFQPIQCIHKTATDRDHPRRCNSYSFWTTSELNSYLHFPRVAQAFLIQRSVIHKKPHKQSDELPYGITSHSPLTASPQPLLALNRGHCIVESTHHILDWSWDEDPCRIRSGYGPENVIRLRRFAIGLIRAKSLPVASTIRRLHRNLRPVFDFLRMTLNSLHTRNLSPPAVTTN